MICYAIALIFWGWLGDRLNPLAVVVFGMVGSAITVCNNNDSRITTPNYDSNIMLSKFLFFHSQKVLAFRIEITLFLTS
jgi:hypothetical protein